MNPYVYSRSKQLLEAAGKPQTSASGTVPSLAALIKSAFTASFSPSVAFAVVVFAASAVAGMSAIAYSEISNEGIAPLAHASSHQSQVLGVATYGYTQPTCQQNTSNCLSYQLLGFSGNGWQVQINYQLQANVLGSVKVNSWPFLDNIRGSGYGTTGYDLLPGQNYDFVLYRKFGTRLFKLTDLYISAPERPQPPVVSKPLCPLRPVQSGCYYANSDSNSCGVLVCSPQPVPAYGYSMKNLSPPNGLIEGWLETLSSYATAPAKVTVTGWAYNNGADASVNLRFVNTQTGVSYLADSVNYSTFRPDVLSYVNGHLFGAPAGSVNWGFQATASNLPAGTYSIVATYGGLNGQSNSYPFNVSGQISPTLTISPTAPTPCYGYSCNSPISINVTTPGSGQSLIKGQTYGLSWNLVGASTVRLALYKGNACSATIGGVFAICGSPVTFAQNSGNPLQTVDVSNTGGYSWTIPTGLADGNDYHFTVGIPDPNSPNGFLQVSNSGAFSLIPPVPTVANGSVTISLDGSSPVARQVAMGSSGVTLGAFRFAETTGNAPVVISGMTFVANTSITGNTISGSSDIFKTFQNFTLWVNGNQVGTISGFAPLSNPGQYLFSFNNLSSTIPAGSSITFVLKGDVNSWTGGAADNTTWTFGFSAGGALTNTQSSIASTATGAKITVARTAINLGSVGSITSPVSVTINSTGNPNPGEYMGIFAVSASPAGDALIKSLTFQQNGTALPVNAVNYAVYDASFGLSAPVGTFSLANPVPGTVGNANLNLNSASANNGVIISAGSTKYFVVTANTTAFGSNLSSGSVGNYILQLTNLSWSDASNSFGLSPDVTSINAVTSSGAGRIYSAVPSPSPSPTPAPTPAPAPAPSPSPTPTPSPAPTPAPTPSPTPAPAGARLGAVINKNGTVFLVGTSGLYGFPDLATFNSWNFNFSQVVAANPTEIGMSMIGLVPVRSGGCTNPLDQINGLCPVANPSSNTVTPRVGAVINLNGTVYFVGTKGLYGFPDLATFNSWGLTFGNVVTANSAEAALPFAGLVPAKTSSGPSTLIGATP